MTIYFSTHRTPNGSPSPSLSDPFATPLTGMRRCHRGECQRAACVPHSVCVYWRVYLVCIWTAFRRPRRAADADALAAEPCAAVGVHATAVALASGHGAVSKREVEVVISRHSEDVGWSEPWRALRTVYQKGVNATALSVGVLPGSVLQ